MQLVGSKEAREMTGLSLNRLREWTGRRGLIMADVPPRGKGTQARYSWRTLMILRVAKELQEELRVELHAHRKNFRDFQSRIEGESLTDLWNAGAMFSLTSGLSLINTSEPLLAPVSPVVVLALRPHLSVVIAGLGVVEPSAQLPLFRALRVA